MHMKNFKRFFLNLNFQRRRHLKTLKFAVTILFTVNFYSKLAKIES